MMGFSVLFLMIGLTNRSTCKERAKTELWISGGLTGCLKGVGRESCQMFGRPLIFKPLALVGDVFCLEFEIPI